MRQTFSDVIGMSTSVTPLWASASTTAFTTAGQMPIVPASAEELRRLRLLLSGVDGATEEDDG